MFKKNIFSTLSIVFLLSGCATLFPTPSEPIKKFTLSYKPKNSRCLKKAQGTSLIIDMPVIYAPLESARIAIQPSPGTIDYIADTEWADRLPVLFQESLIYSLQNTDCFRSVVRPTEGLYSDYIVKFDIRRFHIEKVAHQLQAHIEYQIQKIDMPDKKIVQTKLIDVVEPIPSETIKNITETLDKAHLRALDEAIAFLS